MIARPVVSLIVLGALLGAACATMQDTQSAVDAVQRYYNALGPVALVAAESESVPAEVRLALATTIAVAGEQILKAQSALAEDDYDGAVFAVTQARDALRNVAATLLRIGWPMTTEETRAAHDVQRATEGER